MFPSFFLQSFFVILQAEEEMRQKVALIAKIRAIESVPVIRFKVHVIFSAV